MSVMKLCQFIGANDNWNEMLRFTAFRIFCGNPRSLLHYHMWVSICDFLGGPEFCVVSICGFVGGPEFCVRCEYLMLVQ